MAKRRNQSPGNSSVAKKNSAIGYEWVALSVTTLGALLASLQGSALLIALPDILVSLKASFLTVMWLLLGYLLVTTALVPVVGRLADMVGRKKSLQRGLRDFHHRVAPGRTRPAAVPRV